MQRTTSRPVDSGIFPFYGRVLQLFPVGFITVYSIHSERGVIGLGPAEIELVCTSASPHNPTSLSPYSHTYSHSYYYWYCITHSFFHSRFKSFLFCKSPYRSLSFFSFRIHYMDFPDCLLLLLSISVFLLFSFFLFLHFFVFGSVR